MQNNTNYRYIFWFMHCIILNIGNKFVFSGSEVYHSHRWVVQSSLPPVLLCSFFNRWIISRNWGGYTFWFGEVSFYLCHEIHFYMSVLLPNGSSFLCCNHFHIYFHILKWLIISCGLHYKFDQFSFCKFNNY